MKGLFVKDIELMKQQKQFFILVVVMGVILNLAGSGSVSFATGYFTIVTAIFAITTISYDEFDNGLAFLMTLPVTRKQYVAEKYLLGAGLTAVAWGIATITGVICKGVAELQGCLSETIIGSSDIHSTGTSYAGGIAPACNTFWSGKRTLYCNGHVGYYICRSLYSDKNNGTFSRRSRCMAEWTEPGNGIGRSCIIYSNCIYGIFLDWCPAYGEERILMCIEYGCNYKSSVLKLYQRN